MGDPNAIAAEACYPHEGLFDTLLLDACGSAAGDVDAHGAVLLFGTRLCKRLSTRCPVHKIAACVLLRSWQRAAMWHGADGALYYTIFMFYIFHATSRLHVL